VLTIGLRGEIGSTLRKKIRRRQGVGHVDNTKDKGFAFKQGIQVKGVGLRKFL